ncbi:GGDEF domain-containing protein [Cellvibrio sp. ARAG 10.3]|uniref:GGDEF domain-containing protein n=1 Tax=Cellvibrio sp. ARAG 10.3 TaxID=3451358 RepID=UPI003F469DDF
MQNPPIDERAFYRGVLVLLGITGSVGLATSILHYLEPEPELMDLVIPPLVSIANLALTIWLIYRPKRLLQVVYSAFAVAIVALSLPAWYYSLRAYQFAEVLLIDIFPPISSFLIILIVLVMVILPPRRAFPIMIVAWVLSALPVLGYLLTHREELWSSRGQEMFMSYGLAILLLLVLLPFQSRARLQIERLQHDNSHMHKLAERDELTRQYNRWGGQRLLDDFMRSGVAGSVMMLDIDHFKHINDTHGHQTGDSVLQQFAMRVSSALRSDGYLIRWGGEEFLIVIRGIAERDIVTVAERLRNAINSYSFPPVGKLTASCGATSRREDDTLESLIARADKALYQAKVNGRDQVVCD